MLPHASPTLRLVPCLLAVLALVLGGCGVDDTANVGASRDALTVCAAGTTLEGVDVSKYQGTIDWSQVAASGRAFGIARVGDGHYVDPYFDTNWADMRTAGMVRGTYQFFRPKYDAASQADIVISHLGTLGPGDLPPTIDVEMPPGDPIPAASTWVAEIRAWLDHIQMNLGVTGMIYTAHGFWNPTVGSTMFSDTPLWVANWGVTCPGLPTGWTNWKVHQYTDSGSVPGIAGGSSGAVDLDRFNGDMAALSDFAGSMSCTAHCEGNVLVGADCMSSDCTMFSATCTDDSVGVRCVSTFCPAMGAVDVCASAAQDRSLPGRHAQLDDRLRTLDQVCTTYPTGARCAPSTGTDAGPIGYDGGWPEDGGRHPAGQDAGMGGHTDEAGVILDTPPPGTPVPTGIRGGCGCVVGAGAGEGRSGAALFAGLLVLAAVRRRRRG